MNFSNPASIRYAYQLEGYDEDWVHIGNHNAATYTKVRHGRRQFKVKAINTDGIESAVTTLNLQVLPPWYFTWWAIMIFIILSLLLIIYIYRFFLNKQIAEAEAFRLKELDAFKSAFYTNITHEFRTPLTIILGEAEEIVKTPKEYLLIKLDKIKQNGNNLLRLINQLLDLSQLQSGSLPINLVHADIILYIKHLTSSFHSYAESKNIELQVHSAIEHLEMDFDKDHVQSIVNNLVSNALKFTLPDGKIEIHLENITKNQLSYLQLVIKDTGIGIPDEKLPYIFNRFYQVDTSHTRKGKVQALV